MPFWQGIIGLGILAALYLAISGAAPFWGAGPTWQLAFFYLLAFGGTVLGCISARSEQGPLGWVRGFLVAQIYTPYTWFLWPVLLRSQRPPADRPRRLVEDRTRADRRGRAPGLSADGPISLAIRLFLGPSARRF